MYDVGLDAEALDLSLERNIVGEIRKAIPKGIVLYNHQSDDSFNPLDRQIEVYTYVRLSDIDPSIDGVAKIKVLCRLSLTTGALSLRTIDKNFAVE